VPADVDRRDAVATRGGGGDLSKRGESDAALDLLAKELRQLGDRIETATKRPEDGVARHLRRFMPFYALITVWVLMITVFPTRHETTSTVSALGTSAQAASIGQEAVGATGPADAGTAAVPAAGGETVSGAAAAPGVKAASAAKGSTPQAVAGVQVGTGLTRGGFECKPGVRQIPVSAYAAPCVGKFTGDNGGATFKGVTKDTIKFMRRIRGDSANRQAVEAFAQAAGAASSDVAKQVRDTFIEYFNKTFELYGRKVVIEEYTENSQSNGTEEAQSRGKEGACIDATREQQEFKNFAHIGATSGPFAECAGERKLMAMDFSAYFPESFYRKYHPYLWGDVTECERISYQVAEYIGKRLNKRKAKWAGDPLMQTQERKFGTYVPNNDEYQHCVAISEREFKEKYGGTITSRYNYTLDVSRFADEAAKGVVQFKAAGVTTVINACDPYSTTLMTSAATSQAYYPEWYIIGVAGQDIDSVARLYDQRQREGHLYGMSQLGDTGKLVGPNSEPGIVYKQITGKDMPAGTNGSYFDYLRIFSQLQAAGPILTPDAIDKGTHALPAGGAPGFALVWYSFAEDPSGRTGNGGDHTGIDDSREVWWCESCTSKQDGKAGGYVETYGGKRFRNNDWPAEEPPVYPAK
jgi:hypothetical protein